MQKSLKNRAVVSIFLKFSERFITTGMQVIISIIIARLLAPEDYGIIALINVFITLSTVLIESGFGVGLVQKKELGENDIHTVFYSSLVLAVIIYILIYATSPFVSEFYGIADITPVLRIYAISIIMASMSSVLNSIVSRRLEYGKQLFASVISTFVSGGIGIWMAYTGFGVWALVYQQIAQRLIYVIVMFITTKYFPILKFSKQCFTEILNFSWKIVAAKLIATFYNEVRNLIIGKKYDSNVLGFYNKGQQIPATVATATDYSLQNVMFSVYSKTQDDIWQLKNMVRRSMKLSAYILFPMMIGLLVVADPLVRVLLTEKWIGCVPFFQISCLTYMMQPVNTANVQAINALGKSDLVLKKEIEKRIVATVLIIIAVFINVYAIAISAFIVQIYGWIQYMILNKRILGYGVREQLGDIIPIILASVLMGVVTSLVGILEISPLSTLIIQVLVGVIIYIITSLVFRLDSLSYLIDMIKEKKN